MKLFEYLSAKRKEKLSLLERQNVVSAAAFKKEKKALSESYIALRKAELAAAIKETESQGDCNHKFSHKIITKDVGMGIPDAQCLVLYCTKCGLVKKEGI